MCKSYFTVIRSYESAVPFHHTCYCTFKDWFNGGLPAVVCLSRKGQVSFQYRDLSWHLFFVVLQ